MLTFTWVWYSLPKRAKKIDTQNVCRVVLALTSATKLSLSWHSAIWLRGLDACNKKLQSCCGCPQHPEDCFGSVAPENTRKLTLATPRWQKSVATLQLFVAGGHRLKPGLSKFYKYWRQADKIMKSLLGSISSGPEIAWLPPVLHNCRAH